MLQSLHIENIAVIERADIEPTRGLNVLTGETGSGKSIIIDALGAVLGARTSRDIVRSGSESAVVSAVFTADGTEKWTADYGVNHEEGCLYIMRRITSDGKNTCRVNGVPISVSALRELGEYLLDIHGQSDGQRLADEKFHLEYLDSFAKLGEQLGVYRESYDAYISAERALEAISMDEKEKAHRVDTLRYQIEELEEAGLKPGESEELDSRREMLKNAWRITEAADTAYSALFGDDETRGAASLIREAEQALSGAERYYAPYSELSAHLTELRCMTDEILLSLRDMRGELDFSPDELNKIELRLDQLRRLKRKYGLDEAELLKYLEKIRTELNSIELSGKNREELAKEVTVSLSEAEEAARYLSEKRVKASIILEKRITEELCDLSMPDVKFVVELAKKELSSDGADSVRFLMSANAGESMGRISRIASGGELSRIMLAMKNVLAAGDSVDSMVFDEIDAGVSGIAAQRVGEKLSALAAEKQVICVTHLPQIAAIADTHFDVKKSIENGRTYTHIMKLDRTGRQREIARLTGGDNVTKTALLAAEEQLDAAGAIKKRGSLHGKS